VYFNCCSLALAVVGEFGKLSRLTIRFRIVNDMSHGFHEMQPSVRLKRGDQAGRIALLQSQYFHPRSISQDIS